MSSSPLGRLVPAFAGTRSPRLQIHLPSAGRIIHHYDVVINPVAKVANQKKPAALIRAVFVQLARDQSAAGQPFEKQFAAMSVARARVRVA